MSDSQNNSVVYSTTKDFIASTQKAMRSNVRRMIKRTDCDIVEFSFADSYKDDAKRVFVKIVLNDASRVDFDNNASFAKTRIAKIQYKTSDMSRFTALESYTDLYAKIKEYYQLVQR